MLYLLYACIKWHLYRCYLPDVFNFHIKSTILRYVHEWSDYTNICLCSSLYYMFSLEKSLFEKKKRKVSRNRSLNFHILIKINKKNNRLSLAKWNIDDDLEPAQEKWFRICLSRIHYPRDGAQRWAWQITRTIFSKSRKALLLKRRIAAEQ